MSSVSPAAVNAASNATLASVQGTASVLVLKKALDTQVAGAVQLIQSLPQPALATSGALGTRVNTYA
ncbi:MAG: YjfB family protein [Piscinibacter sp.]|uniref:YjfB family protein n=1 Tax=Piscinibacter sp. TaxID=1903157 RepID=UPI00258AACEA|nr:YjfB family protein [Piscinibacter sp.]MCW5664600.1 YjfB family protein [Piscinibacter sp.]